MVLLFFTIQTLSPFLLLVDELNNVNAMPSRWKVDSHETGKSPMGVFSCESDQLTYVGRVK